MARIRSIYPEVCLDEDLAELDDPRAERTLMRLWTHLDDEGRAIDNPRLIKAALFPLHDGMTAEVVDDDLDILEDANLIIRYEVDAKRYLCAKPEAWARYQHPRHPAASKFPPPPERAMVTADGRKPPAERRTTPAGEGVGDGVGEICAPDGAPSIDAEFAAWYDLYPRKRKKPDALKAYRTARRTHDAPALTAARDNLKRAIRRDGTADAFVPYPGSFLRSHVEDYLEAPPPPANADTRRPDPPRPELGPWVCQRNNPRCDNGNILRDDGLAVRCACVTMRAAS